MQSRRPKRRDDWVLSLSWLKRVIEGCWPVDVTAKRGGLSHLVDEPKRRLSLFLLRTYLLADDDLGTD